MLALYRCRLSVSSIRKAEAVKVGGVWRKHAVFGPLQDSVPRAEDAVANEEIASGGGQCGGEAWARHMTL